MPENTTYAASVKVMRSHDYCHFEVQLGSSLPLDTAGVDAMRKEAARLADKAVAQYKVAKEQLELKERGVGYYEAREAERIGEIAETDRTPEEQATLKDYNDRLHRATRSYDYEDDWQGND